MGPIVQVNDKLDRVMSMQENEVLVAIYLYGAT